MECTKILEESLTVVKTAVRDFLGKNGLTFLKTRSKAMIVVILYLVDWIFVSPVFSV